TAIVLITVTTGSMITVWMGDQITARGIGNGISMLIFAGIVARWPSAVWELIRLVRNGDILVVFVVVVFFMFVAIIGLVIMEQQGERKIPIHYAKRVVGRKMYGGQSTYIPFKINPSGVIPVIFASTFLTFPLQIINGLAASNRFLNKVAAFLNPAGLWYNIILILLIVFFAYFYTQVTLNPTEIAKQIRENGGSIPGIRTDKTEDYMQKVLNRLILPGSLYLAIIAVIPTVIQNAFHFPQSISMLMGGTSLLIVVGVDLDTMSQVEALLKMHHHDGLVKKGKLRSRNL
ncbi:MAG: preprotein translocase subunit SecY, partial [Spirochaetaceae bacterium]|nr:preprotein translocase subunit SecY [Spirochaetaceae bacterium]